MNIYVYDYYHMQYIRMPITTPARPSDTSPRNSRRKHRSSKSPSPSNNGVPGGGRKLRGEGRRVIGAAALYSRSFPVPTRKRSPRVKAEFKPRSRRKRSLKPKPGKSYHRKSRKPPGQSRRKIVAIYTAGLDKYNSISYVRRAE